MVVSDTVRFRNTNNPHGMYIRTEDYTPLNFISITNVPTSQCVALGDLDSL